MESCTLQYVQYKLLLLLTCYTIRLLIDLAVAIFFLEYFEGVNVLVLLDILLYTRHFC